MATILKGEHKGEECEIIQWCNDWFSVKVGSHALIVSPDTLNFNDFELYDIVFSDKDSGTLFDLFELAENRFKRIVT